MRRGNKSSAGAMFIIAVVFLGIGGFMLASIWPNYNKIKHAQPVTLEDVQKDPIGTTVKIQAKTQATDAMPSAGGKQIVYERVIVTHKEGTGKHESTRTDYDDRTPDKITLVDDKGTTLTLPTKEIADEYMEKLGPWKKSDDRFAKELIPSLIKKYEALSDPKSGFFTSDRETQVRYLPANTPVLIIGNRSDQIPGSPVAGLSGGMFKTGIIVTNKPVEAVLDEIKVTMGITIIFFGLGIIFLLIGAFQVIRRML